jgi:RNA polymerase sigma-70 factor (ECF subfamily)
VSTARKHAPSNDDEQLATIYREHFAFVWRSLRRLGVPEHSLEDLTQDVFIVAWRRMRDFEGRSSLRTWLFGISLRVYRTRRRGEWRQRRKLEELASTSLGELASDPTRQHDAQDLLLALLAGLDDDKRAVYVLA